MNRIKTIILCHTQEFIINSISSQKYKNFGEYYFLFMGFGNTDRIENIDNVIISKNLPNNIEEQKNCLQYCGWYSLYNNNLLDCDYLRIIDYDIDFTIIDNNPIGKIKSTIGFDFNFYFTEGFGESNVFHNIVNKISNKSIADLITEYKNLYIQNEWFSSIDILIDVNLFKEFMEWFDPIYYENKNNFYFGMFFERFLTIYLLINKIEYFVSKNESSHNQLKSHPYY